MVIIVTTIMRANFCRVVAVLASVAGWLVDCPGLQLHTFTLIVSSISVVL